MSTEAVSALRQRMIEDMNSRKLCAGTQRGHIRSCKRFAAFLKRASTASVTTGCLPAATVPPTSRRRASCSPCRPAPNSPRRAGPQRSTNRACCHVRAPAAVAA